MKVLSYILTAAAVLVGADVFVSASTTPTAQATTIQQQPISLAGSSGMPTPPPDAY